MKRYILEITVFLCGAAVMIFELAGSRVLGPYLGTSIFIWTSLIGIILGSLSLGYWAGGKLADKKPAFSILAWIIFAGALFIGLTTLIKEPVLGRLPRLISGIKWQSVIASLILFAPASIFLGMVSPYAVRLKIKNLQTSGTTVGNLYAISTIGSIAGTFAAGFLLIPLIGTTNILLSITILLCIVSTGLFLFHRNIRKLKAPIAFLFLMILISIAYNIRTKKYIDKDTCYNRVWIYDAVDDATGKPIKFLRINNESSSAMFLDSDELVFPYAKYYRLAEHFTPGFISGLVLGGAGYSYPKYFLQHYKEATMDVVEIDPELTSLAREYFRLKDDPRLRIFHEDGRTYLKNSTTKYDVIFGDTFKSLYTLPWHLTTTEAVMETYQMLNEGGCVLVNIISSISGPASDFLRAEYATYKSVFPYVYTFAVYDTSDMNLVQSIVLVAVKTNQEPGMNSADSVLNDYLCHNVSSKVTIDLPVLTDDYAPVDYYTNRIKEMESQ